MSKTNCSRIELAGLQRCAMLGNKDIPADNYTSRINRMCAHYCGSVIEPECSASPQLKCHPLDENEAVDCDALCNDTERSNNHCLLKCSCAITPCGNHAHGVHHDNCCCQHKCLQRIRMQDLRCSLKDPPSMPFTGFCASKDGHASLNCSQLTQESCGKANPLLNVAACPPGTPKHCPHTCMKVPRPTMCEQPGECAGCVPHEIGEDPTLHSLCEWKELNFPAFCNNHCCDKNIRQTPLLAQDITPSNTRGD